MVSLLFHVITIMPEMITEVLSKGLVGQAFKTGRAHIHILNPRDFTEDRHRTVDDRPFGGGDGMVFLAEPLEKALLSLNLVGNQGRVVYLSPQGKKWNDSKAREWAQNAGSITLICGRYGGIDQRFIEKYVDEEISIGDYILSGGELGALVLIDSMVRFLPDVLGNPESKDSESFAHPHQLLECPLFTRPRVFSEWPVPQIFMSGHHKNIEQYRQDVSWVRTFLLRPDLLFSVPHLDVHIRQAVQRILAVTKKEELKSLGFKYEELIQL